MSSLHCLNGTKITSKPIEGIQVKARCRQVLPKAQKIRYLLVRPFYTPLYLIEPRLRTLTTCSLRFSALMSELGKDSSPHR